MTDSSPEKFFYSPAQIAMAAFPGGPLAGFWLISKNFQFLNEPEKAKMAIIYGISSSFVLGALAFALTKTFPHFPRYVFLFIDAGALGVYASIAPPSMQGADASLKAPAWRALALGVAFILPMLGLVEVPAICAHILTGGH